MKYWVLVLFAAGLLPSESSATLGRSSRSVVDDQTVLSGVPQNRISTAHDSYTVEEMKATSNVTIRQFVSADDVVFGIAWSGGRRHPDLKQLLGSHYNQFHAVAHRSAPKPGQRHHGAAQTEKMIVETWGHPGNLQGKAYLPQLLPAGMDASEIK